MVAALAGRGVLIGDAAPDVVVVNTCAVTSEAAKASRKLIRRSVAEHPGSTIVVTGCYAVAETQAVMAIPGVDHVVPNADKDRLADLLTREGRRPAAGVTNPGRVRANLKVQTGCDELCSFCIVPQTRGELFSRPITQVSEAARTLVNAGTREVVLTGVHLGKYGWDLPGGTLIDLIRELTRIAGLERIRLSSIEASQVDHALLEVVAAEPKVCRHLHLPLQTGDDRIWKSMRRPGSLVHYLEVAELAKEVVGDVTITTDVMVGFPGEDDRAFLETMGVVERLAFRKLHVFRYSPRSGTEAAADGRRVQPTVVRHRATRLRRLSDRVRAAWMRDQVGHRVRVLIERASPVVGGSFQLSGLTDNYLRVRTIGSEDLVGRTVDVLVTSAGHDSVEGEVVG
jgi:threonylcarbamoyladenosine tRNA methylthiotransferase MtaB